MDGEEVAGEVVGDGLEVAVDGVERVRREGRGDCKIESAPDRSTTERGEKNTLIHLW